MAKFVLDPERMETATDILYRTKNNAEEMLYRAKKLHSEIADDLELQAALEYPQIAEGLENALHTATHAFALLEELSYRTNTVVSRFAEIENENKNRIAALALVQKYLADAAGSTAAAVAAAGAEISDTVTQSKAVEQLVQGAYENLEVANLAAYLKVLSEDYQVETVQIADLQQGE